MPELEARTERVLTLAEAAAFLRVSDAALADKAAAVPAEERSPFLLAVASAVG